MHKILCTCPSRGRPDVIKNMIESFNKTKSEGTDLVIYIDGDDECLSQYIKVLKDTYYIIGKRMNVAQIHNYLAEIHTGYTYYMPINDDITFLSDKWDISLSGAINKYGNGWGIAYGDDSTGNHRHNLPTFGMISANIVKTLGYLYPLELLALFGDTYLLDIGRGIGRIFYCAEVIIKHEPLPVDPNDPRVTRWFDAKERRAYADYINNKLDLDVKKIFDAICVGV